MYFDSLYDSASRGEVGQIVVRLLLVVLLFSVTGCESNSNVADKPTAESSSATEIVVENNSTTTPLVPSSSEDRSPTAPPSASTAELTEATPIPLPSDSTSDAEEEATPIPLPLDRTPTSAIATAIPLPLDATPVASPTEEVTASLPSDRTPSETATAAVTATFVPSQTPTVESVDAQDAQIEAHVDLSTFEYIAVRDLDGYTGTAYAEVAQINNTQTTFAALSRSPDGLWIYVRLQNGTTGWIASEYVVANQSLQLLPQRVPVAPPQIGAGINFKTFPFINVRSGPSKSYAVVAEIHDSNSRFLALGLSPDEQWVLVRLQNNTIVWISREFVVGDQALDGLPRRLPR